jgi:hypothetical protein
VRPATTKAKGTSATISPGLVWANEMDDASSSSAADKALRSSFIAFSSGDSSCSDSDAGLDFVTGMATQGTQNELRGPPGVWKSSFGSQALAAAPFAV